jgi:hypothetical protein
MILPPVERNGRERALCGWILGGPLVWVHVAIVGGSIAHKEDEGVKTIGRQAIPDSRNSASSEVKLSIAAVAPPTISSDENQAKSCQNG